jgi:hypothetical protein
MKKELKCLIETDFGLENYLKYLSLVQWKCQESAEYPDSI